MTTDNTLNRRKFLKSGVVASAVAATAAVSMPAPAGADGDELAEKLSGSWHDGKTLCEAG